MDSGSDEEESVSENGSEEDCKPAAMKGVDSGEEPNVPDPVEEKPFERRDSKGNLILVELVGYLNYLAEQAPKEAAKAHGISLKPVPDLPGDTDAKGEVAHGESAPKEEVANKGESEPKEEEAIKGDVEKKEEEAKKEESEPMEEEARKGGESEPKEEEAIKGESQQKEEEAQKKESNQKEEEAKKEESEQKKEEAKKGEESEPKEEVAKEGESEQKVEEAKEGEESEPQQEEPNEVAAKKKYDFKAVTDIADNSPVLACLSYAGDMLQGWPKLGDDHTARTDDKKKGHQMMLIGDEWSDDEILYHFGDKKFQHGTMTVCQISFLLSKRYPGVGHYTIHRSSPKDLVSGDSHEKEGFRSVYLVQAVFNRYFKVPQNLKDNGITYVKAGSKNMQKKKNDEQFTSCVVVVKGEGFFSPKHCKDKSNNYLNSLSWLKLNDKTGQPQNGGYLKSILKVICITALAHVPRSVHSEFVDPENCDRTGQLTFQSREKQLPMYSKRGCGKKPPALFPTRVMTPEEMKKKKVRDSAEKAKRHKDMVENADLIRKAPLPHLEEEETKQKALEKMVSDEEASVKVPGGPKDPPGKRGSPKKSKEGAGQKATEKDEVRPNDEGEDQADADDGKVDDGQQDSQEEKPEEKVVSAHQD